MSPSRKKVQAARGGLVEARAGYLPSVVSSGIYRKRERQGNSSLRPEDYSANIRVVEPLYTGAQPAAGSPLPGLIFKRPRRSLKR